MKFFSRTKIILRVVVASEFFGHGVFALQGKKNWIGWIQQFTGADAARAAKLLLLIGVVDVFVSLIILFKPIRAVVLYAVIWTFLTILVSQLFGKSVWEFFTQLVIPGAPLALLSLLGWPRGIKDWLRVRDKEKEKQSVNFLELVAEKATETVKQV